MGREAMGARDRQGSKRQRARSDKKIKHADKKGCPASMLTIRDALDTLEGKWKILILFSLSSGPKRFTQISKEVGGITDKILLTR